MQGSAGKRVLIVEDDPSIAEIASLALRRSGYEVDHVETGEEAFESCARAAPDLVVLDVGLPRMDGLEVCRRLRQSSDVPILFLSARDDEIDRILGIEIGGDDYVTKPFSPRELSARVGAILKRTSGPQGSSENLVSHGDLRLAPDRREARFGSERLDLTATEYAILLRLARRPGVVLTREQLADPAERGASFVSDRTIDSHVRNLRAKLKAAGGERAVETVHGVGFRLGACLS